jgi:phosphatidylethanolamine/phosphatidyl-N-methylethanolamine N-methyltransferase|tara:strand:+ start:826 stop:1440 length:615 start_codon:yes stop_codon:yes gene_type:complete
MDISAVEKSYARWAPVYDRTFGALTNIGRKRTVTYIAERGGDVLEVGVGTGLALPFYDDRVSVTGIDFSPNMLAKARARIARYGLNHVKELRQMDARSLDFPDNNFDTVAAMHVLSVVPEPERVMAEIARVCKPGGQVVIANHFQRDAGFLARIERLIAPLENLLGWHSDFRMQTVLSDDRLSHLTQHALPPLGMMTFLVLQKA